MSRYLNSKRSIRNAAKSLYEILPWRMRSILRKSLPSKFVAPLFEQLPISVPFSLHIDPTSLCNFRCTFCPTGDLDLLKKINRPKGTMPFELFKKIIDDLSIIGESSGQKVNELHLYKDGEPFINKDLGKMAAYAIKKNVAVSVQTTTNAALITKEKAVEIIESGLNLIRVSIEHINGEGYKTVTQNYSDYDAVKENVRFLFEEKQKRKSSLIIKTKIVDMNFDESTVKKFFDDFGAVSDQISVNNLMGWSYSGLKDFTLGTKVKRGMGGAAKLHDKNVCPEPFRSLAVNFDGQASVCCVDWSFGTIVGDFNNQTFNEIWNGGKLKEFRALHLKGKRSEIKACADCHYLKGFPDHLYLDDKVENLEKIYN